MAAISSSSGPEGELERVRAEKDHLSLQYRSLLGKLTAMRNTLGDKLKEDAVSRASAPTGAIAIGLGLGAVRRSVLLDVVQPLGSCRTKKSPR